LEPRLLLAAAPPVVTSFTADNRGMVELVVDRSLDPTTVNANSVRIFTSGRDGLLGTSDDSLVSSVITYDVNAKTIRANASVGSATKYRVQVFGNLITSADGVQLDGEFNGKNKKTGDGVAGGTLEFFTKSFALPIIRFTTFAGTIDVEMFSDRTPLTVQNFFNYMNRGDYDTTFFHRTVEDFIVQAGGFTANAGFTSIRTDPAVRNEPGISNTRGTIAMAKLGNQPNSATSQFFFNLGNNASNLDNQNGGFTVFGKITSSAGLGVMDDIGEFERVDATSQNGAFGEVPVKDADAFDDRGFLVPSDVITITRVAEIMDITAEPFRQLPTKGQVALSNLSGSAQVIVYSLNGVELGSTSAFLNVTFSGDRVSSIKLTGAIPAPIGIQIISSQSVQSFADARATPDANLAFVVSNARIESMSLKGGFSGYDINDTLLANNTLLAEDIDSDGRRDDPTAMVLLDSSVRTLTIGQNLNGSIVANHGVQSMTVRGTTTNANMVFGPADNFISSVFSFARVQSSTLTTQAPITSLTAHAWDSTGQPGAGISAPSLGTLNITGASGASGDFQGDLTLTGSSAAQTLRTATIKGIAFLSRWTINGSVGNVNIRGGTSEYVFNATGDVGTIVTDRMSSTSIDVDGKLVALRVSEWVGGRLDAGALFDFSASGAGDASGDVVIEANVGTVVSTGTRSFRVGGMLRDSSIQFSAPVSGFSVASDVRNSSIGGTSFNALALKRVVDSSFSPTGKVKSVTAWEWIGGNVASSTIESFTVIGNAKQGVEGDLSATVRMANPRLFRVHGSIFDTTVDVASASVFLVEGGMTNTILTFNQTFAFILAVNLATIKGDVVDSQIIANDAIGALVVGSLTASTINIGGDAGAGFQSPASAFNQNGFARSITVLSVGQDPTFVRSSIVGNFIETIRLRNVDTFNNNQSFGISARGLGTIELIASDGPHRFSNPTEPFFLDDFEIRPNFVAPDRT